MGSLGAWDVACVGFVCVCRVGRIVMAGMRRGWEGSCLSRNSLFILVGEDCLKSLVDRRVNCRL